MRRIRILMYNNVGHYPPEAMEDGIHPESLAKQLEYLIAQRYSIVTLDEAIDCMQGTKSLPENSLAITIDGGFADAFSHVLPTLERYGVKAAFFVAPGLIGNDRVIKGHSLPCMNWEQVRAMAEKGMIIGHYGCNGRPFIKVPRKMVEQDIIDSKPLFEKYLGIQPDYYSVNEGTPEPETIMLLKENGYKAMLTKSPTKQSPNLYAIGRIQSDDDDLNIFLTKISRTYLLFKDSPYWRYVRKYRLDRAFHHLSEFYNSIKGASDQPKRS